MTSPIPSSPRFRVLLSILAGLALAPQQVLSQDHGHGSDKSNQDVAHHEDTGAHEALTTLRPGLIRRPDVVGSGTVQVESGYSLMRAHDETRHAFGELVFRVGTTSWGEAVVALNSFAVLREGGHGESGIEDAWIGYKALLGRGTVGSAVPTWSLTIGTALPVGDNHLGSEGLEPSAHLGARWSLTERFGVVSSVAYARIDAEHESFDELTAAASMEYAFTGRLHGHVEYARIEPLESEAYATDHVSVGGGFHVTHDFAVDTWLGYGRHHGQNEYFVGVGIGRRF